MMKLNNRAGIGTEDYLTNWCKSHELLLCLLTFDPLPLLLYLDYIPYYCWLLSTVCKTQISKNYMSN